ncbi:TraR/DksA family transcriptional regulator [Nonomuraea sp. NPDC000554]|uniref:TraR/DksA family transcriptional regulator n=1 Tax=Nonomuraea sp. NPDC000554 TaxID=3154259 RepID=UPI00332F1F13
MTTNHRPTLSSVQIQTLRQELQEHLQWRITQRDNLKASADGTNGADHAWQDILASLTAADRAIAETQHCLDRLDEGSYGQCAECEVDIPFERLKIRPLARYCITCQRSHEAA